MGRVALYGDYLRRRITARGFVYVQVYYAVAFGVDAMRN
jgi:hypothetical protein